MEADADSSKIERRKQKQAFRKKCMRTIQAAWKPCSNSQDIIKLILFTLTLAAAAARAQNMPGFSDKIPEKIRTPETVETRTGKLSFPNGFPSDERRGSSDAACGLAAGWSDDDLLCPNTACRRVNRGNWIQSDPKKGWFAILRVYKLAPAVLRQDVQPSEMELLK
jgi:hypothetical protein